MSFNEIACDVVSCHENTMKHNVIKCYAMSFNVF